jgi:hypothetical protein
MTIWLTDCDATTGKTIVLLGFVLLVTYLVLLLHHAGGI